MFELNIFGNPEPLSIYLTKVDGSILGCIDEIIDVNSASISIGLNRQYELSFTITRCDGMNIWYDSIHEGVYFLVDKVGLFKSNQPTIVNDGIKETKNIVAYSCESELEDKTVTVSINTGKEDSSEYLVKYEDNETEVLLNPYTGLPYDWIVLYNMFPEQLSEVKEKLLSGYYGSLDQDQNYNVINEEKINELINLFNLIPRLKHKIVPPESPEYTHEPIIEETYPYEEIYEEESIDEAVLEEAVISSTQTSTDSTVYEYVSFEYSPDNGNVTKIILFSDFKDRIDELIIFYSKYRNQLSLLSIVLEETGGWTAGDIYGVSDGNYSIANTKWQFEIDESVYSFLTNSLSKASNSIITFDLLKRKVGIIPIEHLGNNTGIVLSYETLINSLNISTEEERLTTRLKVSGGDGLDIRNINFGSDYIADISYKLNAVGADGKRIYVSDDLASRYAEYEDYVERRRETQITYMKRYANIAEKIDELDNRVPNDSLKTDWGTFSQDELNAALITYKNLLATLTTLYKEDYGYAGLNGDGSINENYISNTPYWFDYVAYKNTIEEIECAIDVFPYYSDQTKWTAEQIQEYKDSISAWETTWSLFGIVELRAKIESYQQNMDVLAEEAVIRVSSDSNDIKQWNELSTDEKIAYGVDQDSYKYDLYMSYYNNMQSAQSFLDTLIPQREELESNLIAYRERIKRNVSVTSLENWFPENECDIIRRLYRDSSYENDNIFITSTDTSDERIDKMVELLNDAKEQASIYSRPQIIFSVDSENLLGIKEFEPLWSSFIPGNYMMVQYKDNELVKLRMTGFSFNPCLPSNNELTIEFSNFIKAKSFYNDWASILGNNSGSGSSSRSGTSGSTVFGNSDVIDVTISNTMLAKLLNTETFGARVKEVLVDTINAEYINAKRATFTGLANGVTIIDGNCITTGVIRDLIYKGLVDDGIIQNGSVDNTSGSVINLDTGQFNFAGGKIKYDGTLVTIDSDVVIGSQDTIGQVLDDITTAQETADSKTKVYYGTPSTIVPPTYSLNQGDYLVDTTDGSTYRWDVGTSTWIVATNYASAIEEAIEDLEEEIIIQIDGKIETWTQSTNPATAWNTDALRKKHDSDLWFYTGITNLTVDGVTILPSKTYKYSYSTGKWSLYNSPNTSLFDFADGKTTVYYGTPTGTYQNVETGDYLVDSTDGCTYKYNGTSWVKVTDYKSAISTAVNQIDIEIQEIESDLKEQIDAKVETWAQNENPRLSWDSADLTKHNGDLWFYTGTTNITAGTHGLPSENVTIEPSKTYQYDSSNNKWVLYNSPTKSLYDFADGKSTIYYGTTSETFADVENGDYLVDATDGCTYKRSNNTWVKVTDYGTAISSAVGVLEEDLQAQIDGKIETWAQNTNPASSWSTSELKSHDNDLWYYTGISSITVDGVTILPSKTYKYNYENRVWTLYNSPSRSLFDLADGKSTIFYGETSGTYTNVATGDYLVDPSDGCTYRWNGSSWVKVTDYTSSIESAINSLEEELIEQIDSKIETWTKSTDPAASWQSGDYESHDGDLWYYTGMTDLFVPNLIAHPHGVYQFHYNSAYGNVLEENGSNITDENGNIIIMESPYYWTAYAADSNNLFDVVDGKSTIFYGTTSDTFSDKETGDYLVNTENGSTYKWDGTTWVKVTDYQSFTNEAIESLSETLQEQIDGKVETWAQAENPALSWGEDELEDHSGDLWYYTGTTDLSAGSHGLPSGNETIKPSKTYQYDYSTGKWVSYNSPTTSLFDIADGKSTIYYGTPSGTYSNVETGDYLVDNTDGCTYKWSGSSWVKVTDYKTYTDNGISALSQALTQQIDAKIETWAQAENPALAWSSADLPKHNDDIWYYTGTTSLSAGSHGLPAGNETINPTKTYRYNSSTGKWVSYNSPSTTIFDFADGKATVYYGTHPFTNITTQNTNDIAIDSTTKKIYRYSGSSWTEVDNYSTVTNDLQSQIDKKIETYYQPNDPFYNKTTASLKSNDGDIWFYTGNTSGSFTHNATYRYSWSSDTGTYHNASLSWIECEVSSTVFDEIDGKSTVYSGTYPFTNVSSPQANDVAIDDTTQKIYKYSGSSWVEVVNYASAFEDLEDQIDAKIETWAQNTNPALSWTDLAAHNGDLWLYTGLTDLVIDGVLIHPQGIYKFKYVDSSNILGENGTNITDEAGNNLIVEINYKWEQYSSTNSNLFDMMDGKTAIYYGSTSSSYSGVDEGDYLVDPQNGTTYRRTGGQWVATTKTGGLYGTCSTAATAKEKVVVCNQAISIYEGLTISVKFANANTYYNDSNPLTLNIGNLGVKNIYYNGKVISSSNRMYWTAGTTVMFMYDGIGWIVIGNQQTYEGKCSTASSTVAKNCKIENAIVAKGTVVNITFTNTNSAASPTLNVIDNTTNAATIVVNSSNNALTASSQYNWNAGATVGFTFDGTYWRMNETTAIYNTNSYMRFEAAYGLMIANMTNGVQSIGSITNAYNTLLTSTDLRIRYGTTTLASFGTSIWLGNSSNFSVTSNGILTAQGANISGTITATEGTIGGWTLGETRLGTTFNNSDNTYNIYSRIEAQKGRFVTFATSVGLTNPITRTVSVGGSTLIGDIVDVVPKLSIDATLAERDSNGNIRGYYGYTIAPDEMSRVYLDAVTGTGTTVYVYREYASTVSGYKSLNKAYDWLAYYLFNQGAIINIGNSNTLVVNNGSVSINSNISVPNRTVGDNSTHAANTAYVKSESERVFDSKIKFIDVNASVSPSVTISGNSYAVVTVNLSTSVPSGYTIRSVIWRGSSYYIYFTATSIDIGSNSNVEMRIRNLDTSSRTLSEVRLTIICMPS